METSPSQSSIDNGPEKDDRNIKEYEFLGYQIFVGRNAASNENLIQEHVKRKHSSCVWMHAVGAKGAHVILCCQDKPTPEDIIMRRAADLARKFSKSNSNEVFFATLKDVYKPIKGRPGIWRTWRQTTIIL